MTKFLTKLYILVGMLLSGSVAFADTPDKDPALMFKLLFNVGDEVWYIIKIVLAVSGLAGLVLVVHGLHKIKAHSMDSQGNGGHFKTGLAQLIVGGFLFAIPVAGMVIGSSLFDNSVSVLPTEAGVFHSITTNHYSS